MSKNTRDSYDDTKNRKKVEFQLGMEVVDNELNELQNICMTEAVEGSHASFTSLRNTDSGPMRYGYVQGSDFRPKASGTPTITISSGVCFIDGYRFVLANDLDLTTAGLTFPAVGGSDVFGYIYVDVTISEINSTTDPSVATPLLGETTVREVFSATWKKSESTVSFSAAFAGIAPLPIVSGARAWKGNTTRVFVCRYQRTANTTNITQAMLLSLLKSVPAEGIQRFIKTFKHNSADQLATPSTLADGMVVWNANLGVLQIGGADYSGNTGAGNAKSGLIARFNGGPDHLVANSVFIEETQTGTGNADAPVAIPDWTKGWTLTDGQALGWYASSSSAFINNEQLLKGGTDQGFVYDIATVSSFTPTTLLVQKLTVQNLSAFQADPSSFILCHRMGNDLVWWNGWITRGGSSDNADVIGTSNYPALETPGEAPTPWRAVVASAGNKFAPGSNTVTGPDALERALNNSVSNPGSASPGIGNDNMGRHLNIYIRGWGTSAPYVFGRGLKKWGNSGDLNIGGSGPGSSVYIDGDAGGDGNKPLLQFTNPQASTRLTADTAVFQLQAARVTLKNLRLTQDALNSTFLAGYLMFINAETVEIENCVFDSGIFIQADNIRIKNCFWTNSIIGGAASFVTAQTSKPLVAQNLFMTPAGTLDPLGNARLINWEVSGCTFYAGTDTGATVSFTGQAGVVVDSSVDGVVRITDNYFKGTTQDVPSIHLNKKFADITIAHNKFSGALGRTKTGNDQNVTPVPFNGDYSGCPLDTFVISGGPIVADGYISATAGRDRTSKTSILHNTFDFSAIANVSYPSVSYIMWGAFMAVFNSLSATNTASYCNINYEGNRHIFALDSNTHAGWSGNSVPVLWGFYLAPTIQDGAGMTAVIENINVSNNYFDLGGQSITGGVVNQTYRSIFPYNPTSWPAGGTGFITDGSMPIGILLRNGVAGNSANRSAIGIKVANNRINYRINISTGAPIFGAISGDLSIPVHYWFSGIFLSSGDQYTFPAATAGEIASNPTLIMPEILGNQIVGTAVGGVDSTGTAGYNVAAINCMSAWKAKLCDNVISMYNAGGSVVSMGIVTSNNTNPATGSYLAHLAGNTVTAQTAFCLSATDAFGNNELKDSSTASTGGNNTFNVGSNFA